MASLRRPGSLWHTSEGLCAVVGGPGIGAPEEEEEKGGSSSLPLERFLLICQPCFPLTLSWNCFFLPDSECHVSEYLSAGESSRDDPCARMVVGMCAVGSCLYGHLLPWFQLSLPRIAGQKALSSHLGAPQRSFLGEGFWRKASSWREACTVSYNI